MEYDYDNVGNGSRKFVYVVAFLLVLAVGFLAFFLNSPGETVCGDDVCGDGENCLACPLDCKCGAFEYCSDEGACLKDVCGDGRCSMDECSVGCTQDCDLSACCGNGECERLIGESCRACPADCGECSGVYECGDGICDIEESCSDCPADCGECQVEADCGDGACTEGENCYDCPKDCKCNPGEYCDKYRKECMLPECGNDVCEPYENSMNCCIDCECELDYQECDPETKGCVMPEVSITDERIKELVNAHYEGMGQGVEKVEIEYEFEWKGKTGKRVIVTLKDTERLGYVLVTDAEEVIDLPFY